MAAALVDGDRVHRRSPTTCATPETRRRGGGLRRAGHAGDRVRSRTSLAPDVCGVGCGGPMLPGGETVSPLNIRAWGDFPLRDRLAAADRTPGRRRQRRQGAGARRGLARGGPGARQLSGHGGVDRHRWRHRARRPAARRGPGECRAHRARGGRTGWAGVRVRGTGLSRGRGVRAVHRGDDRASGVGGPGPGAPADRHARRPGRGLGGQSAGPRSWPWWPARWPSGSARPFFDAAQEEIGRRARLDFSRSTRIIPAGLGADGPLVGAAAVGRRALAAVAAAGAVGDAGGSGATAARRRGSCRRPVVAGGAAPPGPLVGGARRRSVGWPRPAGGVAAHLPLPDRAAVGVPDGHRLREPGRRRRAGRRHLLPRVVPVHGRRGGRGGRAGPTGSPTGRLDATHSG